MHTVDHPFVYNATLSVLQCNLKKEDLVKAREVMNYLKKNYQDRFDYEFLVNKFHINEYKLKQAFKEVTNDNIHSFLTKIRIEEAKQLLETTHHKVKYIAYKVGLDKSNFNIQFKKFTGKTPSDWRSQSKTKHKENPESPLNYPDSRRFES